ncbi:MarR family transcriptional regulator [Zobellella denitrificans]|uniref:MarR family transcriptional regulator n=1 Tax=Zobellella denitrificans TaxID=347534 RepID=A0A231MYE3_9GAMM|nr:MarR family transcriptional regulator [Zobellella denitrificans]ATG73004.1 MarR family transcriptional regulator [Zobellella denitrificans]OXS15059.1 MarR family transcriptional regulator [Zobellella denitrificans]
MEKHEEVLVALRQIIRAIDLHSRQLSKASGLTGPQLLLMQAINEHGDITMRKLAQATNMSQATATTIIDRLEQKQLVRRERSQTDKRKVHAVLTDEGRAKLKTAPRPLQESFIQQFQALEAWEQNLLLSSVQRISSMMNANDLDVAPLLQVGSLIQEEKY